MSEVTKLYENAGVETNKYKLCCTGCKHIAKLEVINGYPSKWICDKYDEVANCDKAEPDYPPFTAEKQINIIKWLLKNYDIGFSQLGEHIDTSLDGVNCISGLGSGDTFEESLAQAINDLWQDLTPEEKQQVKGILE